MFENRAYVRPGCFGHFPLEGTSLIIQDHMSSLQKQFHQLF